MADNKFINLTGLRHYHNKLISSLEGIIDQIEPANTAPLAPASTAVIGTSERYARADHVHPLQTSVSGNAGTATQFAANKTVQLTGDVTGSASSKGGWTVATTLANSGVTASTYGSTAQQEPAHGATFSIPYVTVDAKGRVTAAGTSTVKLPADNNTDTLVTQNVSTANEDHPILLTATKDAAANQGAKTSIFAAAVKVNPSTGTITGNKIVGDGSGLTALNASNISSGTIDIARLPAGALERCVVVQSEAARYALTTSDVQKGDTVKQKNADNTYTMYFVVDDTKLNSADGYEVYTAGSATSVPWSGVTDKPTTISGYGITDANIASGTITLGSSTITPLTASSALDATKLTGTASVNTTGNSATSTKTKGVYLVIPNETTQTATLTATVTGITEYFDGLMVAYRAPFNTAASSTLNINSLGAKPIYYGVNTASKDYYPANRLILLVYETTTTSTGCWKMVYSYDSNNNNYDRRLHNQAVKAAAAVTSGTVIVGTSAGYKTAASGVTFDISYPILYASEAIAANATNAKTYEAIPSINLQTTKASWTGTQYAAAYLVGTLSGTTFTIDSSIFTTTVPSTADGKVYIPLGVLYSTYQIYFAPTKDIYQYTNGSFHPYDTTTAAAGSSNGAVKINGTDVTVYTHPTTSGNKHIPSGGSSGQFLKWSADGTAVWAADNNTWTAMTGATSSANGTVGYINAAPPSDGYNTKFWRADGSWQVPYTHPTTSGNKHIPSGGSSGQFLKWSADGTATWAADNNSTTHLYAGASTTATANATSATANTATYLVVCDDSTARNAVQVKGSNGTTVSAVNGAITIDSVSLSAVTNAEIDAAIFA